MYKKFLPQPIKVFGKQVTTFPAGIGEAFEQLVKMLPPGDSRAFYGIGECTSEGIVYKAAAAETFDGEAEHYQCERYIIEQGDYLCITVNDWRPKTDSIKSVFDELYRHEQADRRKPSIEIYINDMEMVCMVKTDPVKTLMEEFETVTAKLVHTISAIDEQDLNRLSSYGSWTAAQVAEHLHLSNKGMKRIFNGKTETTERDPGENVAHLKSDLLDFKTKNQAAEQVRPEQKIYNKKDVIEALQHSKAALSTAINKADLSLIYSDFPVPTPGGMSGLELLAFIVYHTERHIHQINMIRSRLAGDTPAATTTSDI